MACCELLENSFCHEKEGMPEHQRKTALGRQAWASGMAVASPLRLAEEVHIWKAGHPGSRSIDYNFPIRTNKLLPKLKYRVGSW